MFCVNFRNFFEKSAGPTVLMFVRNILGKFNVQNHNICSKDVVRPVFITKGFINCTNLLKLHF